MDILYHVTFNAINLKKNHKPTFTMLSCTVKSRFTQASISCSKVDAGGIGMAVVTFSTEIRTCKLKWLYVQTRQIEVILEVPLETV